MISVRVGICTLCGVPAPAKKTLWLPLWFVVRCFAFCTITNSLDRGIIPSPREKVWSSTAASVCEKYQRSVVEKEYFLAFPTGSSCTSGPLWYLLVPGVLARFLSPFLGSSFLRATKTDPTQFRVPSFVSMQLSLLIHPDKCKHPKAQEAFQG